MSRPALYFLCVTSSIFSLLSLTKHATITAGSVMGSIVSRCGFRNPLLAASFPVAHRLPLLLVRQETRGADPCPERVALQRQPRHLVEIVAKRKALAID